jgi:hypothetical protein
MRMIRRLWPAWLEMMGQHLLVASSCIDGVASSFETLLDVRACSQNQSKFSNERTDVTTLFPKLAATSSSLNLPARVS